MIEKNASAVQRTRRLPPTARGARAVLGIASTIAFEQLSDMQYDKNVINPP
jgi:hypothetical protein